MGTHGELLRDLIASGEIDLHWDPFLESEPPPLSPDWDRVEGMMLGLAIGDGLGNTSEGRSPRKRHEARGEIRHYLPNRYAGGRAVGLPSDDSQLAFWTLECALQDGALDPEHLAEVLATREIYGIGRAVAEFQANYRNGRRPWYRCGAHSAGNGALMRIAPVLIPHLRRSSAELWADAALAASVTHNDATSIAACVAWLSLLWQLLAMPEPPDPLWWPETWAGVARRLEGETRLRSRGGAYADYEGPLWRLVIDTVPEVYRQGLSVEAACNAWHSGAYLLETMPCVLYILMRHGHEPEQALIRAVNDTWDNDTIAAVVGSAVGALHGRRNLPAAWLRDLTGRTSAGDDGRMQALLAQAARVFGPEGEQGMADG